MSKTPFEYADLIGTPFKYGGRGTDALDCYGLVMLLHKRQGITLPDVTSTADTKKQMSLFAVGIQNWQRVDDQPYPGDAIAFRIEGTVRHCGVLLDFGQFIHTWEKTNGVTIESIADWSGRIVGYYRYAR